MSEIVETISCTFNIPNNATRLAELFEALPEFVGYVDGCARWFGADADVDGARYLASSVEPAGLVVSGVLDNESWYAWKSQFLREGHRVLGFVVMEAEDDASFCNCGRPYLEIDQYERQQASWPNQGRHIMAQYDEQSIVVYQAYRPSIANFAVEHQRFGGEFSLDRMSWIKPNFLWMMYRSGWGTKPDQEVTLAIKLQRTAFDALLKQAVHSSFVPEVYETNEKWQQMVADSDVRLQWDPDHDPSGQKLERRAIQLGMRHEALMGYSHDWLLGVCDISDFVASQRENTPAAQRGNLLVPKERVYPVTDPVVARKL